MLSVLIYHTDLSKEYQQPVYFFLKKYSVKRRPFDSSDTLTPRIVEACSQIILGEYQGLIRHSVLFFDCCLSLEKKIFFS